MKRTVYLFTIITTIFLNINLVLGQNKNIEKTIDLKGSSKTETVTIDVGKNVKALTLNIKSKIDKGTTLIEIIDPDKKEKNQLLVIAETRILELKRNKNDEILHSKRKTKDGEEYHYLVVRKDTTNLKNYKLIEKVNSANGEINKEFKLPTEGEWIIKVKSVEGTGKIYIKTKTDI